MGWMGWPLIDARLLIPPEPCKRRTYTNATRTFSASARSGRGATRLAVLAGRSAPAPRRDLAVARLWRAKAGRSALRQGSDAFEDGGKRGRGVGERQVADVEVPHAEIDHRAQGSRADVNRRGARGELGGQRCGGDRQKSAQLLECPLVR